jgi:hypothetical protein
LRKEQYQIAQRLMQVYHVDKEKVPEAYKNPHAGAGYIYSICVIWAAVLAAVFFCLSIKASSDSVSPRVSRQQIGLLVSVLGTAALALSVRIKKQYEGDLGKAVDEMKKQNKRLLEPTETYIVRPLFWFGLGLVAIGALLQW